MMVVIPGAMRVSACEPEISARFRFASAKWQTRPGMTK